MKSQVPKIEKLFCALARSVYSLLLLLLLLMRAAQTTRLCAEDELTAAEKREEREKAYEGVPRSKKREVCEGMAWME